MSRLSSRYLLMESPGIVGGCLRLHLSASVANTPWMCQLCAGQNPLVPDMRWANARPFYLGWPHKGDEQSQIPAYRYGEPGELVLPQGAPDRKASRWRFAISLRRPAFTEPS